MRIEIDGRYYEHSSCSNNGQYTLALSEFCLDGSSEGMGSEAKGGFVLLSWNKVIVRGILERPNDGKVANQGNFIINDWMLSGGPEGTFYAFDSLGNVLISQKYQANLGPNGISPDGLYAVCQTLSSDNRDSNRLSFFDLGQKKMIWNTEPESGPADEFRFDEKNFVLCLQYQDGSEYRYDFNGTFLDRERLAQNKIDTANGYELYEIAMEKISEIDPKKEDLSLIDEPLAILKKALEMGISSYYESLAHRQIGELHLERGEQNKAIVHFEKAIAANPKIGVKKALAKLRAGK